MNLIASEFARFGYPSATTSDKAAWSKLIGNANQLTTTYIEVGLFGYDLTGLISDCKSSPITIHMCDIFEMTKIDGWAIGVYGVIDSVNYYNNYFYGVGLTYTGSGVVMPTYNYNAANY